VFQPFKGDLHGVYVIHSGNKFNKMGNQM